MHTWLPSGLMERATSARRMFAAVMIALMIFALPAMAQQAQPSTTPAPQQPGSIANPQPGTMVQEQVANPPGHGKTHEAGGEANLPMPDMAQVSFFNNSINGSKLLSIGLLFCAFGGLFGLIIYMQLKNLPVHRSMREISELIYETCKTYLVTQGKFLLLLEAFIAVVILLYFGLLLKFSAVKVIIILLFSLIGIAGSYGVAWFGIRVNTFANSRTAFAGLKGKPFSIYAIPLKAGMSIGMMLISVELLIMLCILLFIPRDYAGSCFVGFAIGES
ncbi:MAG TPA: sodium/proton-translocating pyrophosphatase, partial [Candidatus Acidoferrales bacterium]|nr:sodium/proton-translocating pyrophosphatase [Candidatus Acidoferrales bacterium]